MRSLLLNVEEWIYGGLLRRQEDRPLRKVKLPRSIKNKGTPTRIIKRAVKKVLTNRKK